MSLSIAALSIALVGYIGPGGGIGLLGPLLGVILAVVGALAMVALWPLRYFIKKARSARTEQGTDGASAQAAR
jgi:hypothetical protein